METNPITDALQKVKTEVIQPPFVVVKPKEEKSEIRKPIIVEQPVVENSIQELTTQQKLDEAQDYLEHLNSKYNDLGKQIDSIQKIVNDLAIQADLENPKETNQEAISGYLASKNRSLEARSHRIRLIAESGLQLKDLAQNLKSPIDARLSRKSKKR